MQCEGQESGSDVILQSELHTNDIMVLRYINVNMYHYCCHSLHGVCMPYKCLTSIQLTSALYAHLNDHWTEYAKYDS